MSRIVILGGGESGWGSAVLAKQQGYDVFLSDNGNIQAKYKTLLQQYNIEWEDGGHTEEKILNADEVIKSPGIPLTAPLIRKIDALGIPIISELEFAARYTNAKMICITGSNGKTTTTTMIYEMLRQAGYRVGLAGNIGKSMAFQVAETNPDYFVLEVSSFQLDNMYQFRANVAVLLNITPDHLDRYGGEMQRYVDAKMRIIRNQQADDAFVFWADDPIVREEIKKYPEGGMRLPFADRAETELAGRVAGENVWLTHPQQSIELPLKELALQGKHNLFDSMAAGIAAGRVGVPQEVIEHVLKTFSGIEHRLEYAGEVDGVKYINDSKATNVDACYYALQAQTTPVVLILGGLDKGNDYEQIRTLVQEKCRALVYLGADNHVLHAFFDKLGVPVADTHDMKTCMEACRGFAQKSDTVLLSPCCASFDLFKNMEDRGQQFKGIVAAWQGNSEAPTNISE